MENGTLLYFMEEAPGVYESADHTVTGAADKPKLYVPVYDGDELQPSSFEEVGAREQLAAITDFTVTMGLPGVNQRQEPGFVLDNGLVLLESERDSQGNYKAGAGTVSYTHLDVYKRQQLYRVMTTKPSDLAA